MNQRKWRDPYAVQKKKKADLRANPLQKSIIPASNGNLALVPKNEPIIDENDLKSTLYRIRDRVKNVRNTIQQVEQTVDNIFDIMVLLESMSETGKGTGKKKRAAKPESRVSANQILNALNSIDFKQVMNLLQSPLVQALLSNSLDEEDTDEKKEA